MKRLTLLASLLLLMSSFMLAQSSMKLYIPHWNAKTCDDVKNNNNYYFTNSANFIGKRTSDNSAQRSQKVSNPFSYPTMLPMIMKVEVPTGVSEVTWNISGNETVVLLSPKGSSFIDKNHVVTPVMHSSTKVKVENPYIKFSDVEKLKSNWRDFKSSAFIRSNFYSTIDKSESTQDKEFVVESGYSYLVIMGTSNEYIHVVASSSVDAGNNETVVGHVKFYDSPRPEVKCRPDFSLKVAGAPSKSPLLLPSEENDLSWKIDLYNDGESALDLSQVLVKIEPIGGKSWFESSIDVFGKGKIQPHARASVKFIKKVNIYTDALSLKRHVAKAKVSILYPTAVKKSSELNLTYTKSYTPPPPPPPAKHYTLAGIGAKFSSSGKYVIFNTAIDVNSLLTITSPESVDLLPGGNSIVLPSGATSVSYILYNGTTKKQHLGPYKLRLK